MAIPWERWLRRIAIAIAIVVAAVALLWAVWWLWSLLSPQWDGRTIIAIAVAALPPLAAIWWLWWRLPRRQVERLALKIRDPKARADTEDNFRKTVGQALGGAAVLFGAGAAYLQFSQQQQTARDQLQAANELRISNQAALPAGPVEKRTLSTPRTGEPQPCCEGQRDGKADQRHDKPVGFNAHRGVLRSAWRPAAPWATASMRQSPEHTRGPACCR